jgi:hemerythrin superfamily protein
MTRIIDAIKQDHREIEDYYNKILSATTEKEKIQWQNQFTWELARHSIGEELVVYPVFEKNLPDGRAMADKDRHEHNTVRLVHFLKKQY